MGTRRSSRCVVYLALLLYGADHAPALAHDAGARMVSHLALLLYGADHTPAGAARPDDILVRHRQEVALLDRELLGPGSDGLHMLHHLVEAVTCSRSVGES